MNADAIKPKYRAVTVSGKYATGTTTLAQNLKNTLGWRYVNTGAIQREYDAQHNINSNKVGATMRTDEHEREMEKMTEDTLKNENNIIYEAWLSGFMARNMKDVLKVLLICSEDSIRVDRIVNRDNMTVEEAKTSIKKREEENTKKWQKLYGDYDFWDPKYYDLVIDTYSSGAMETLGKVLDKLNSKK